MNEQAFIALIIANPDDDDCRLQFADWLDEQGQYERAEFVRIQLQLARWDCGPMWHACNPTKNGPACEVLKRREWQLLQAHGIDWTECLAPLQFEEPFRDGIFRRGFVHRLIVSAEHWLAHADAILVAQPVREVMLLGFNPYPPGTGRCAWFHESVPGNNLGMFCNIPQRVFRHLKGSMGSVPKCKWYDTREAAYAELKDAFEAEFPGIKFTLPDPYPALRRAAAEIVRMTGPAEVSVGGAHLGTVESVEINNGPDR